MMYRNWGNFVLQKKRDIFTVCNIFIFLYFFMIFMISKTRIFMIEIVSNKFTIIRPLNQWTDLQSEGQGDCRPGSPLDRSNHCLHYYDVFKIWPPFVIYYFRLPQHCPKTQDKHKDKDIKITTLEYHLWHNNESHRISYAKVFSKKCFRGQNIQL